MAKFSPMMTQYLEIKKEYSDCILFFRLGDFYEMFFEDAKIASEALEIALTGRECGQEERAPMCGVPYHACETYIARLISKGYKVAICEQTEDPAQTKGIVKREVVRIVTPGTIVEANMLDDSKNNFICAVCSKNSQYGLCFADISTGSVYALSLEADASEEKLISEIGKLAPSEVIVDANIAKSKAVMEFLVNKLQISVSAGLESLFERNTAILSLMTQFNIKEVEEIGIVHESVLVEAVGALIGYLRNTQKKALMNINHINFYSRDEHMQLDLTAQRNLELVETMRNKEKRGSLLWVLDKTKTAAGGRMLRQWMDKPLMNVSAIGQRLDAVEELCQKTIVREEMAQALKSVLDMERLLGKMLYGTANACDLNAIAQTLSVVPGIKAQLYDLTAFEFHAIDKELENLSEVYNLIRSAIADNPAVSVKDGNIIREGYNATVDELRHILQNGKAYIAKIESQEKEKTGIKNLKIGYNRVFGYYIEVSKSNIDMVPDTYIRKQTLANGERYFTEELKEMESTILGARDHDVELEYELFSHVCTEVLKCIESIKKTASALAHLDVLISLSKVASDNGYVKPIVDQSDVISIKDGRHPVVEKMLLDSLFVPNDTELDCANNRMSIITGPNMAGKSTYMRQVALIVFMAQIGSFVPAKSAHIGVVDKIFTRIGASDDLTSGQSTFMVEMSEVADIIRNATSKSLLLLDEIGRGTSTFDGMSIARSVIEYTVDKEKIGAKTLFATHYHELTDMENEIEGIKNYNIAVKKRGFDITFLRKIVRGRADESYGIEVAKLAGLPEEVINRSKEVLDMLEAGEAESVPYRRFEEMKVSELSGAESEILEKLCTIDANTLSPIEALNEIFELSNKAKIAQEQNQQ